MLGNPTVPVMCDTEGCDLEDAVGLTALARGAYDERDIESDLEDIGWSLVDGKHLCCNCTEELERQEALKESTGMISEEELSSVGKKLLG